MNLPITYTEAARALAACIRTDEVKDIRDKAIALAVYAKQAKDTKLIAHATEIRKRAERRLGELMGDNRKAGKMAKAGRKNRVEARPNFPSLASQKHRQAPRQQGTESGQ